MAQTGGGAQKSHLPEGYAPSLDFLRIIACGAVMLHHMPSLGKISRVIGWYSGAGYLGVDLFMLISGWLIGGQLIRERLQSGAIDLRRFYLRRWLRTLPPYYVMLVVLCFGQDWLHSGPDSLTAAGFFRHFLFLQNYTGENHYGVSWSLCVEEHFYLVCPFVIAAAFRIRRPWALIGSVLVVSLLSLLSRELTAGDAMGSNMTHQRMDGLWIGVLMAFIAQVHPQLWARAASAANILGAMGVALMLVIFRNIEHGRFAFVWSALIATYVLAMIFLACVQPTSFFSKIRFPGLRFLGELTFPLYLTHNVVPKTWTKLPVPGGQAGSLIWGLVVVFGAALVLQFGVIDPSMKLRSRILRRPRLSAPPQPQVGPAIE